MSRFESKFLLSIPQYECFRSAFSVLADVDPHAQKDKAYPVFSAYFDTPDLLYFYQKIDGQLEHVKVRLRRYSAQLKGDGNCFLEVKAKLGQEQVKERQRIAFSEQLLDPTSWWLSAEQAFDAIFQWMPETPLMHVCNVYYEREAFAANIDGLNVRLNFDRNLVFLRPEETQVTPDLLVQRDMLQGQRVLLEIKGPSPELPPSLHKILAMVEPEQVRVSKYAEAIQNLDIHGCYQEVIV